MQIWLPIIVILHLATNNIISGTSTATCPCNITQFENDFYLETSKDFRVIDAIARKYVVVALVAQIPLILQSCPDFCLPTYIAKAAPVIDAGTLKASDYAAKRDTQLAVAVVKNCKCKYNYASLLADSLPGITVNMNDCASKVGKSAITNAVEVLKELCPNLKKVSAIKAAMAASLETTLRPLASVAASLTAKNIVAVMPCGLLEFVNGSELLSLPGIGAFSVPGLDVYTGD